MWLAGFDDFFPATTHAQVQLIPLAPAITLLGRAWEHVLRQTSWWLCSTGGWELSSPVTKWQHHPPWCCCLGVPPCRWRQIIPKHIATPFGRFWKYSRLSIIEHVTLEVMTARQPRDLLRKAFGSSKIGGRNCCFSGTRKGCEQRRQAALFEARHDTSGTPQSTFPEMLDTSSLSQLYQRKFSVCRWLW